MSNIKIMHYRDHHNGGKFDGNCYVDMKRTLPIGTIYLYLRFRITDFPSGYQYLWGQGFGVTELSLKLVRSMDKYYLRVTSCGSDINFDNYPLGSFDEEYLHNIKLRVHSGFAGATAYISYSHDGYGSQYDNIIKFADDFVHNTIDPVDMTLGATRYLDGGAVILNNSHLFTGVIYDAQTIFPADSLPQRLVFYEGYNGVGIQYIADYYNQQNSEIINRSSDFWSVGTDISGSLKQGASFTAESKRDKMWVQEYCSGSFSVFNYDKIVIGDTIGVYVDGVMSWLFNVYKTKIKDTGYSMTVSCEDIFMALKRVIAGDYFKPKTSYDLQWWTNIEDTRVHDTTLSLESALGLPVYLLQYDNLVSIDFTGLLQEESPYFEYKSEVHTGDVINYGGLALHIPMAMHLGCTEGFGWTPSGGEDKVSTEPMHSVYRELLGMTRVWYQVYDGRVIFKPITYGRMVFPTIWYSVPVETENNLKYNIISVDIQADEDGLPILANYDTDGINSDDELEIIGDSREGQSYNNPNRERSLKMSSGLWLRINKDGLGSSDMGDRFSVGYFYWGITFPTQYALALDYGVRKTYRFERLTVPLIGGGESCYKEREDDLINRTTEIYQEAATV